jgi:peptidoglycan/xylan/chitin deacetylase (PgdA/CDA1 family)
MKTCFVSIDVEQDNFGNKDTFIGVEKLDDILNIFKKHQAHATLFVTGEVLEKYPNLVKKWSEDSEIGCHNYKHFTLDHLDFEERERQISDFVDFYKDIFGNHPKGFRAPRNFIDNEQFKILEKYEFLYDSSVIPRYPWPIRNYIGYRGRAPLFPYFPDEKNYRKKGRIKILEIPESPISFGIPPFYIPVVATWIRKWGISVFKILFRLRKPKFVSLSMHSWDGVKFAGGRNSGEKFLKQLDEMLGFLKKMGYEFKSGEKIYGEFCKNK